MAVGSVEDSRLLFTGSIPRTVEQSAMTADDVYVLVVDANDNFLYQVQDLKLGNPVEGDNYYTRQLEGTMLRTVGGEHVSTE